jgi:hypothetical protein
MNNPCGYLNNTATRVASMNSLLELMPLARALSHMTTTSSSMMHKRRVAGASTTNITIQNSIKLLHKKCNAELINKIIKQINVKILPLA